MRILLIALAAVLALLTVFNPAVVIDETELAIVTRLGKFRRSFTEPGLYLKMPLVENVSRMESRVLARDTSPGDYLTLDKKKLVADPVTRWRIKDPLLFYKTVQDEVRAARRLDDIVKSEIRSEISSRDFGDIIGNKRGPMMDLVTERVQGKAREYGIEVVDVRIKRADLPKDVQDSVFQRMRAERDREAKRYRSEGEEEAAKIRAQTDKEVTILLAKAYQEEQHLKGAGESESTRIYAESLGQDPELFAFLRSLEAYEGSIAADTEVVLSTSSELLKYFSASTASRR